jgi:hypothetical protein
MHVDSIRDGLNPRRVESLAPDQLLSQSRRARNDPARAARDQAIQPGMPRPIPPPLVAQMHMTDQADCRAPQRRGRGVQGRSRTVSVNQFGSLLAQELSKPGNASRREAALEGNLEDFDAHGPQAARQLALRTRDGNDDEGVAKLIVNQDAKHFLGTAENRRRDDV